MSEALFTDNEWNISAVERTWKAIDKIAKEEYGLDYYRPQIEIITSEQMLDAYSSVAMPIMYNHWSFGKSFIQNENAYKKGQMGLAYEVVINTNPIIAYLMEDNTMTMQTLVLAHAVCGHGSFFKNNYLFQEWTDPEAILDYLKFARQYVSDCEKKYGRKQVEILLDACHALQHFGVDKYKRPNKLNSELQQRRMAEWKEYMQSQFSDVWRTIPGNDNESVRDFLQKTEASIKAQSRDLPEENLLYFLEKNAPLLEPWQREIIRIVRKVAQYFYPQMQTQLMNEGWATFIHYELMNNMSDKGLITSGSTLEFLNSHAGVVRQLDYDQKGYSGINVYALGFAMMKDIKRICTNPDDEDRYWFPDIAGQDWLPTMKNIVEMYRDESFVLQFLSPKVIRQFKLFALEDKESEGEYKISRIHDDDDIYRIREILSKQYSITHKLPRIEITKVDWDTDRRLYLKHTVKDGQILDYKAAKHTLSYLDYLWQFAVDLEYVDLNGNTVNRVE